MSRPNTPYTYPAYPKAETLFLQSANNYPTLHLPVANFISGELNPVYDGASNLANFVLRRAIDEQPTTRDLFEQRQLWLVANFTLPTGNVDVDLQVHREYLSLCAGQHLHMPRANWRLTAANPPTYEIIALHEENALLFDYTYRKSSLPVAPQVYDHNPTNAEYLRDPALGYACRFWQHEQSLTSAAIRQELGFTQYVSVERTVAP